MVICRHVNDAMPSVLLTEPFPSILRCENKLFEIDRAFRGVFRVENVVQVNITDEGLYTMFQVGEIVNETWHDRWKPDLNTVINMADEYRLRSAAVLAPIIDTSKKVALELMAAGCASVAGDARLQRKARLLETTLLSAMELMDMEES